MKTKIIILLSLVLWLVLPRHTASQEIITPTVSTSSVEIPKVPTTTVVLTTNDYIRVYATKYNIPEVWLRNLGWCESTMNQKAIGDGGNAIGLFQYWKPTWSMFTKQYGHKLDINSSHDQIRLTAWALSKGLGTHWTCDYKTGKVRAEYQHLFD